MKDMFGNEIKGNPFNLGLESNSKNESKRDSRRAFTQSQRNEIWDRQKGKCAKCGKSLKRAATHYDHKKPWEKGGKTEVKNGQALCADCHSVKSNKDRLKKVDKKRKSKPKSNSFVLLGGLPKFRQPENRLF